METLTFQFPADTLAAKRAHVGVVGSGDLEVLLRPGEQGTASVRVRTSVEGFGQVWQTVLSRFFQRHPVAGSYELNDFGATPGVVTLRLLQLAEMSAE